MVPGLVPGHHALRFLPILKGLCSVGEAVSEAVNHIVPLLLPRTDAKTSDSTMST